MTTHLMGLATGLSRDHSPLTPMLMSEPCFVGVSRDRLIYIYLTKLKVNRAELYP